MIENSRQPAGTAILADWQVSASLCLVMLLCASGADAATVKINRRDRIMILTAGGADLLRSNVGLGRGGIKKKLTMADEVTPTGSFAVDLILSPDPSRSECSPAIKQRYSKGPYAKYFVSPASLSQLFAQMNSLDFNGDGKPDGAYGQAYIGLDGPGTGPKMSLFRGKPYWFSIAMHGTPRPQECIGKYNSGGCIHLPADVLSKLLDQHMVSIGSSVSVSD